MFIRKPWVYIFAILFILLGGINWLSIGTTGTNLVELYITNQYIRSSIYILVGISALALMFHRDTYLPFLGQTALPCSVLTDKVPSDATISIKVQVKPDSKVVYWAAEHNKDMTIAPNPWEAYQKYENAGIITADNQGTAILKVRDPSRYTVLTGTLDKHIHYRYCKSNGLVSRVFTVAI